MSTVQNEHTKNENKVLQSKLNESELSKRLTATIEELERVR